MRSAVNEALEFSRGHQVITSDDVCVALEIEYLGSEDYADVEVNASGDLILSHGDAVGTKAGDTTIQLPTGTAGSAGTIDVSNAAADTLGEVVDHINASANWRARIVDGLRTDSANDSFLDDGPTECTNTAYNVKWDTTTALHCSKMLTLAAITTPERDAHGCPRLYNATGYSTYSGSGSTSKFQVYRITVDEWGNNTDETKIFEEDAGATATSKAFTIEDGSCIKPTDVEIGYKMLVRILNTVAMSSQFLSIDSANAHMLEV